MAPHTASRSCGESRDRISLVEIRSCGRTTRRSPHSATRTSAWRFPDELRGVIEEPLLSDSFAFPALISEFFHLRDRSVQPLKSKHPSDDDSVSLNEGRANTLGIDGFRSRKYVPLVGDEDDSSNARWAQVLAHRCAGCVELLNRIGVRILFDSRNEALKRCVARHVLNASAYRRRFVNGD